jgi:hypothetical protein
MPSFDAELMARLRPLFEAARDTQRAEAMSRYMREGFAFYGIQGPGQREIARGVTVRRFVRDNTSDLSGPSRREALKWLERGSDRSRAR